jgi:hypothetical protein
VLNVEVQTVTKSSERTKYEVAEGSPGNQLSRCRASQILVSAGGQVQPELI